MNQELAIEFIRQRMQQMGVQRYHFELFFYYAMKTQETFKLYNEYWYLIDWVQDLTIVSDTAIYGISSTEIILTSPPEFTGDVRIRHTVKDHQAVQFIRVIIQEQ